MYLHIFFVYNCTILKKLLLSMEYMSKTDWSHGRGVKPEADWVLHVDST